LCISQYVSIELFQPEFLVRSWRSRAFAVFVSMPETTMNKERDLEISKHDIRRTR
jgi:hypothetical protein